CGRLARTPTLLPPQLGCAGPARLGPRREVVAAAGIGGGGLRLRYRGCSHCSLPGTQLESEPCRLNPAQSPEQRHRVPMLLQSLLAASGFEPQGFWGPPTSSVDWCEANYVHSFYVCEWYNTLSSAAMVVVGTLGACWHWRVLEWRALLALARRALVGAGRAAVP